MLNYLLDRAWILNPKVWKGVSLPNQVSSHDGIMLRAALDMFERIEIDSDIFDYTVEVGLEFGGLGLVWHVRLGSDILLQCSGL